MRIRNLFILCFVVTSFCINPLFAKKVDVNQAKQVATNFYSEKYNAFHRTSLQPVSVDETFEIKDNSATATIYIFNMNNNGFVIVAANDIVSPVLGYSFEGRYDEQNLSPEFTYWINNYKTQISSVVSAQLSSTPQVDAEWARLNKTSAAFTSSKDILSTTSVGPLCESTWDQVCCYNALCPSDATTASANICHHAVTGCVATAMAQEMYYYRYPLQGVGSYSYTDGSYGTLSANFGATTYNWNAMTNSCSGTDSAIATLIYHCGVAVKMQYGVSGSSAMMNDAVSAFKNYFKYTGVKSSYKGSGATAEAAWDTLVASELTSKRPVIYSGDDPTEGGHAWICDGYQYDNVKYYFHFNWGWSGVDDGYFLTNDLAPPGEGNFSTSQNIIYNIYPSSGYPYYCSSTTTALSSPVGTLEDGSGPSDYQDNDNCSWLIAPYGANHINITFDNFSTADANDVLTIYNGSDATAPVLKSYTGIDTGSVLPSPISSTSPTVFLSFVTDGSGTSSGWKISYTTTYPIFCTGVNDLTAASDTFSNGSGIYNYDNNTNCKWLIEPTNAGKVMLHFLSFNTEATYDVVKVTDNNGTLLGAYSGTTLPADVTSTSGQMLVEFTTNATNTAPGWKAVYTSTPAAGIEEFNSIKDLAVYPNPAKDKMHISFMVKDADNATLEIFDLTGQLIFSQAVNSLNGAFSKDIDISDFARGIYNLRVITSKESINKKIVVE
jgi:hypothetical protein